MATKQDTKEKTPAEAEFDITGDIEKWVGIPLAGSNMKEPVQVTDIRRWVQAMQNPNPLHFDEDFASKSRFGRIVAPQSFVVCTSDSGCGAAPAIQGHIPGTHLLFAGDEWWFHGPRVFPGDRIRQDRMLHDYKVRETGFAGKSMISRGDTTYINDRGEVVAKQRATCVRYNAAEALKRNQYAGDAMPEWTDEMLDKVEQEITDWIVAFRSLGHERRLGVKAGDTLPRRAIGPHTVQSMVVEWTAFPVMVWNSFRPEGSGFSSTEGADWSGDAGWLPELSRNPEGAKIDPGRGDPVLRGPARGHLKGGVAKLVGLPRGYGFGVTMGTWLVDYVANWAGEWGELVYCKSAYRAPAFEGDVAYIDGKVTDVSLQNPRGLGQPIATVEVTMTNQLQKVIATATAHVRLPTQTLPAA
ncbi:MAG: MaoC family dehydratase N-terminal domain-containing protein [Dehalococcoidia bacterium]